MEHFDRFGHGALAAVYVVATAILVREHAVPHACCAFAAAAIYAALCFASPASVRVARALISGVVGLWRKLRRRGATL
jgi:hypothetical protein